MKYLHFTTHANPNKNTIKQGLLLSNKFMESARWILLHSNKKYSDASDNDFHFNGFKVWRDVRCGLLVLESYSSNRNGIVNSISFKEIAEWPDSTSENKNTAPF
ncbi:MULTISPECIES: hypothetical protein [Aeromonas]|uniref:hypothetical protein n=1 Tax=Aeromonas TaxID=642 RepID=UPI0022DF2D97|nr:hypothetical protein [Aeromonas sp. QDB66]